MVECENTLIRGVALVIPGHLIDAYSAPNAKKQAATFAKETQEVERRAVEAALAAERPWVGCRRNAAQ